MIAHKNAIILLIALLIGCGSSKAIKKVEVVEQETCKDYYDIGAEHLDSEAYDFAVAYLERAVECSTEFVDAHMLLGDAYFDSKDFEKALDQYVIVELRVFEPSKLALRKAFCYRYLRKYAEATEEYLKAIERSEDKIIPFYHLIDMNLWLKEFDKSLKYIMKAFDIAPNDAGLNCMLGDTYLGYGDNARAIKHYGTAKENYNLAKEWYKKSVDDGKWGDYAKTAVKRVETKLKLFHPDWK